MRSKDAMTLDRMLSRLGLASRTVACEAIRAGRIKVNGRIVRDPDFWVRAENDTVHLDGNRLQRAPRVYLLFYKPKGVITSHGDPDRRKTIYDFLDKSVPWVVPVGRLDRDTSGLLDFAEYIANPESGIRKTYLVKLNSLISEEQIGQLRGGVMMKRGDYAQPLSVRRLEDRGRYSWLEIVLTEGKNREVRRMTEAVGFRVLKLVRTAIGPCTPAGLQVGQWRKLLPSEIRALRAG
jgi:23S rRNA pseudouridine2605 synthase